MMITSSSTFSYAAALFCEKLQILALPFWYSYASIPNLVTELAVERNEAGSVVNLSLPENFNYGSETETYL